MGGKFNKPTDGEDPKDKAAKARPASDHDDTYKALHADSHKHAPPGKPSDSHGEKSAKASDKAVAVFSQAPKATDLNGNFHSPDGKESYKVVKGEFFDKDGKSVGRLDTEGRIQLNNKQIEALNSFKQGWIFEGKEHGLERRFETRADMPSGKMFIPDQTGKPIEYVVRMGMLINKSTGEQYGKIVPPKETADGKMIGGYVMQNGSDTKVPLSNYKHSVFDLSVMGQSGLQGRKLQGVCLGPQELQADGSTKSSGHGGIFNVSDAIDAQQKKMEQANQIFEKHKFSFNLMDLVTGKQQAEENKAKKDTDSGVALTKQLSELVKTGKINAPNLDWLRKMSTDTRQEVQGVKDGLAAQRYKLDAIGHELETLPSDTKTLNGSVKVRCSVSKDTPEGYLSLAIRNGRIIGKTGQAIATLDNAEGRITMLHPQPGQLKDMNMKDLQGAIWHLEFNDHNKQQKLDWISLGPKGIVSAGKVKEQAHAETKYAEAVNKESQTEQSAQALAVTRKKEETFKTRIDRIVQHGIQDGDLPILLKGPRELVRYGISKNDIQDKPPKIEIPQLANETECHLVNGQARIGGDAYQIKSGELYKVHHQNNKEIVDSKPSAKLEPGYVVSFYGSHKQIALANTDRVLLSIKCGAKQEQHRIIGMGSPKFVPDVGYQSGGLVDTKELLRQAHEVREQAARGNEEYFKERPYLTGAIGNFFIGDREATLQRFQNDVDAQVTRLDQRFNKLFSTNFADQAFTNNTVDANIRLTQVLMHNVGVTAQDANSLAQEGIQMQKLASDSLVLAATTVATAGIGTVAAGALQAGKLTLMGATALEIGAGAGAGATFSAAGRTSQKIGIVESAASGAIEGATMGGGSVGGKLIGQLTEAGKLSKAATFAVKSGHAVGDAAVQTAAFTAAGAIRERDWSGFNTQGLAMGTVWMLAGTKLGHGAASSTQKRLTIAEGGLAHKTISDTVMSYTNSGLGASTMAWEQERERIAQELKLDKSQISDAMLRSHVDFRNILGTMHEQGVTGALTAPLLSAASHAVESKAKAHLEVHAKRLEEQQQQRTSAIETFSPKSLDNALIGNPIKNPDTIQPTDKSSRHTKRRTAPNQAEDKSHSMAETREPAPSNPARRVGERITTKPLRDELLNLARKSTDDVGICRRIEDSIDRFEARAKRLRLDKQQVAATYQEINELLTSDQGIISKPERSILAMQILRNAENPWGINQGNRKTCNVAAVSVRMYAQHPAMAARLIKDIALKGEFTTADGTLIKIRREDIVSDRESADELTLRSKPERRLLADLGFDNISKRSYADQIIQVAAVNAFWQRKTTGPDGRQYGNGNIRYEQHTPGDKFDTGERLVVRKNDTEDFTLLYDPALPGQSKSVISRPHLKIHDLEEIYHQLTSKKEQFAISYRETFPDYERKPTTEFTSHFSDESELRELIINANPSETKPLLIQVDCFADPFYMDSGAGSLAGSASGHVIALTGYNPKTDLINADNTWGPSGQKKASPSDHGEPLRLRDLYLATMHRTDSFRIAILEGESETNPLRQLELLRTKFQAYNDMQTELKKLNATDEEIDNEMFLRQDFIVTPEQFKQQLEHYIADIEEYPESFHASQKDLSQHLRLAKTLLVAVDSGSHANEVTTTSDDISGMAFPLNGEFTRVNVKAMLERQLSSLNQRPDLNEMENYLLSESLKHAMSPDTPLEEAAVRSHNMKLLETEGVLQKLDATERQRLVEDIAFEPHVALENLFKLAQAHTQPPKTESVTTLSQVEQHFAEKQSLIDNLNRQEKALQDQSILLERRRNELTKVLDSTSSKHSNLSPDEFDRLVQEEESVLARLEATQNQISKFHEQRVNASNEKSQLSVDTTLNLPKDFFATASTTELSFLTKLIDFPGMANHPDQQTARVLITKLQETLAQKGMTDQLLKLCEKSRGTVFEKETYLGSLNQIAKSDIPMTHEFAGKILDVVGKTNITNLSQPIQNWLLTKVASENPGHSSHNYLLSNAPKEVLREMFGIDPSGAWTLSSRISTVGDAETAYKEGQVLIDILNAHEQQLQSKRISLESRRNDQAIAEEIKALASQIQFIHQERVRIGDEMRQSVASVALNLPNEYFKTASKEDLSFLAKAIDFKVMANQSRQSVQGFIVRLQESLGQKGMTDQLIKLCETSRATPFEQEVTLGSFNALAQSGEITSDQANRVLDIVSKTNISDLNMVTQRWLVSNVAPSAANHHFVHHLLAQASNETYASLSADQLILLAQKALGQTYKITSRESSSAALKLQIALSNQTNHTDSPNERARLIEQALIIKDRLDMDGAYHEPLLRQALDLMETKTTTNTENLANLILNGISSSKTNHIDEKYVDSIIANVIEHAPNHRNIWKVLMLATDQALSNATPNQLTILSKTATIKNMGGYDDSPVHFTVGEIAEQIPRFQKVLVDTAKSNADQNPAVAQEMLHAAISIAANATGKLDGKIHDSTFDALVALTLKKFEPPNLGSRQDRLLGHLTYDKLKTLSLSENLKLTGYVYQHWRPESASPLIETLKAATFWVAANADVSDFKKTSPAGIRFITSAISKERLAELTRQRQNALQNGKLIAERQAYCKPERINELIEALPEDARELISTTLPKQLPEHLQLAIPPAEDHKLSDKQLIRLIRSIANSPAGERAANQEKVLASLTAKRIQELMQAKDGLTSEDLVLFFDLLKPENLESLASYRMKNLANKAAIDLVQTVNAAIKDKHAAITNDDSKADATRRRLLGSTRALAKQIDGKRGFQAQHKELTSENLRDIIQSSDAALSTMSTREFTDLAGTINRPSMEKLSDAEQAQLTIKILSSINSAKQAGEAKFAKLYDRGTKLAEERLLDTLRPSAVDQIGAKSPEILKQLRSRLESDYLANYGEVSRRQQERVIQNAANIQFPEWAALKTVLETFNPGDREHLTQLLGRQSTVMSIEGLRTHFNSIIKYLEDDFHVSQLSGKGDSFIHEKKDQYNRSWQEVNVLSLGEVTSGGALGYLFRKSTGMSVNMQVLGKEGKLPTSRKGQKWVVFDNMENATKEQREFISKQEELGNIIIARGLEPFHRGVNLLDLAAAVNYKEGPLRTKLERMLEDDVMGLSPHLQNEQPQNENLIHYSDREPTSAFGSPTNHYDLIATKHLMFLREQMRNHEAKGLDKMDPTKFVSSFPEFVHPYNMLQQAQELHAELLSHLKEKNKGGIENCLFASNMDNGGSTHLVNYLYRIANNLEAQEHDGKFMSLNQAKALAKRAKEKGLVVPEIVYLDDYTHSGTQAAQRLERMSKNGDDVTVGLLGGYMKGLKKADEAASKDNTTFLFARRYEDFFDWLAHELHPDPKLLELGRLAARHPAIMNDVIRRARLSNTNINEAARDMLNSFESKLIAERPQPPAHHLPYYDRTIDAYGKVGYKPPEDGKKPDSISGMVLWYMVPNNNSKTIIDHWKDYFNWPFADDKRPFIDTAASANKIIDAEPDITE